MASADSSEAPPNAVDKRTLRVVHVGPDPAGRGGIAAVTSALLDSELAARHRLDLIVTHRVGGLFSRAWIFLRAVVRLAAWCRGSGPRVVHLHGTVRGSLVRKAVCIVLVRALGRPVLLQVHAGGPEVAAEAGRTGARNRLLATALGRASAVVAVSSVTARALESTFGLRDVGVVPNPAPAPVRQVTRRPGDPVKALYLGGFANPVKGGAVLVSAVAHLPPQLFELVMAGPGDPPPDITSGQGIARWCGWLEGADRDQELAKADILVLPSLSEGLPVALLEGLANGLAIVATRTGGIPEAVEDGREALLVDPGDPRALADALTRLAGDGDLRQRLGDAARVKAGTLSSAAVVDNLDERYRRLAARGAEVSHSARSRRLENRSPDVAFLSYHSIAGDGPAFLSLPPQIFECQLARLRARGYRSGGHAELRRLARGETLPGRTVFLTFDDGFRDTYEVARPLLEAYGFRAIVFLLPALAPEGGPLAWPEVESATRRWPGVMRAMTWEMAEEMAATGHEFGAHTVTHPRLPELDDERLDRELVDSRALVIERLGSCGSVAYPFGQCDDRVASAAARAGFEFGFTLPFGAQRNVTPLTIPRVNIDHRDVGASFSLKLSGAGRRLLLSPVKPALRAALGRERRPGVRYASRPA